MSVRLKADQAVKGDSLAQEGPVDLRIQRNLKNVVEKNQRNVDSKEGEVQGNSVVRLKGFVHLKDSARQKAFNRHKDSRASHQENFGHPRGQRRTPHPSKLYRRAL